MTSYPFIPSFLSTQSSWCRTTYRPQQPRCPPQQPSLFRWRTYFRTLSRHSTRGIPLRHGCRFGNPFCSYLCPHLPPGHPHFNPFVNHCVCHSNCEYRSIVGWDAICIICHSFCQRDAKCSARDHYCSNWSHCIDSKIFTCRSCG